MRRGFITILHHGKRMSFLVLLIAPVINIWWAKRSIDWDSGRRVLSASPWTSVSLIFHIYLMACIKYIPSIVTFNSVTINDYDVGYKGLRYHFSHWKSSKAQKILRQEKRVNNHAEDPFKVTEQQWKGRPSLEARRPVRFLAPPLHLHADLSPFSRGKLLSPKVIFHSCHSWAQPWNGSSQIFRCKEQEGKNHVMRLDCLLITCGQLCSGI